MSLITRCPACGTLFKVVPDQLRISEGWVRCGHCTEVFDANAHMQDAAALAAATAAPPAPAPAPAGEQAAGPIPASGGGAAAGQPASPAAAAPEAAPVRSPAFSPPWASTGAVASPTPAGPAAAPPAVAVDESTAITTAGPPDPWTDEAPPPVAQRSAVPAGLSRWFGRPAATAAPAPAPAEAARDAQAEPETGLHAGSLPSPGEAPQPSSPGDGVKEAGWAAASDPATASGAVDAPDTEADEAWAPDTFANPDSALLEAEARELRASPLDAPFYLGPSPTDEATPEAATADEREPEIWARSEQEPDLHDLEFVRKARRRALWQRRSIRILLGLACVLLGLGLAAQYAVQERDRLAATQPGLRPLLSALCAPVGCRVGLPHQIDAIAIDASQFTRLRGDSYRLSLTLHNQAALPVATPAIELTLTDSEDQPVVRRVLQAAELAPGMDLLAPNAEWSGSVGVTLSTAGLPARIAGYRVLAFYP